MKCDKCGKEAKAKTITSKSGKSYDGFECVSGCVNLDKPRYAYFFFAPKEKTNGGGKVSNEAIVFLKEISETLKRIEKLLPNTKAVNAETEGPMSDEDIPF